MAKFLKSLSDKLTPSSSRRNSQVPDGFITAPTGKLFPQTNPLIDGEECLHDCADCTVHLPPKWEIDEEEELYGHVNGWNTHLLVATGKSDWVRDVADEKGSIMEAVEKGKTKPSNGKLMLSACNMPIPYHREGNSSTLGTSTTVLLLPAFVLIEDVTPASVPELITNHINNASTNVTPLVNPSTGTSNMAADDLSQSSSILRVRACPHRYLILLCSQKTRDARCGQSAPLLRKEFERHLRPLGLYRDLHDERPGGVGIYFISHMGGHKFAANCFIYRRADGTSTSDDGIVPGSGEASQCIWLARIRPEDCENIVRYTVLQGKVVKPDRQLRGGFDRARQLVSW